MQSSARRLFTLRADEPIPYREMMGDLDFLVRIKTEHPDPKTLLEAYGRAVAHGCFRVPAKLAAGRPFVLTFLTKSNVAAIKGTAEVIGHEDGATWVRFLSAADPRRDADIVLTDVKVMVVPSTVVTKPISASAIAGEEERGAVPTPIAEGAAAPATPSAEARRTGEQRGDLAPGGAPRGFGRPPGSQPAGQPSSRPGSRPGSKVESAVADVPVPTAAGTGRSEALERGGLPDGRAPQRGRAAAVPSGPAPGQAGSRDPRKATPLRSMPAISTAPPNREAEPEDREDSAATAAAPRRSGDAATASMRRPDEAREAREAHEARERRDAGDGRGPSGERTARRSAARPTDPALRRSTDRQSGSAPAIAAARTRTGRRSAQHPAVRLVTPLSSETAPGGEPGSSENRTMPLAPEAAGAEAATAGYAASAPPPPHHLADPGYPMVVRTRGPSRPPAKHPRGLPVMPAIAVEGERQKRPSYPMHHAPPRPEAAQLRSVPMASSSGPLPGDERGAAAASGDPRQEVSGSMPLVSVVPWWTQPPERAATRSPVFDPAALGSPHASAEAAVDFAEASAPDLARPSSEALEGRGPYPRPPTMAEHAAPAAVLGDERSGRFASALAGVRAGGLSAEAQLVEAARRSAVFEAAAEPVARRVMWGSIAIAITCVAVAIGAVWWALELRASARAAKAVPTARSSSGAASPAASPSATTAASPAASSSAAPAKLARGQSSSPSPSPASSPASSSSPSPPSASSPSPASASASAPPSGSGSAAPASHAAAPAPAGAAPRCQLRVTAGASPAAVAIDGEPRGETPALLEVPCGAVSLELRRARYAPATRTVEAKPGVTEVEVRLARPVVSVRILSRPAGVTVRLNGKDLGKTPLSAEVPAFEHATLIWLAANGATKTQQIYPQQDGDSFSTIMGR